MFRRLWLRRRGRWSPLSVVVIFCAILLLSYQILQKVSQEQDDSGEKYSNRDEFAQGQGQDSLALLEKVGSGTRFDFSAAMAYRKKRYFEYQNKPAGTGPGERGAGVKLSREEQVQADRLFKKEAFNIIASDMIAMDRSVKDTRDPAWVFHLLKSFKRQLKRFYSKKVLVFNHANLMADALK